MHAGQGQIKVRQSWRTWEVWEPLYACRAGADQGEAELEAWEVWEPLYACRAGRHCSLSHPLFSLSLSLVCVGAPSFRSG